MQARSEGNADNVAPGGRKRKLLLAGLARETQDEINRQFGELVEVLPIGIDDTLSVDILKSVDVVLVDLEKADSLAYRFANLLGNDTENHLFIGFGELPAGNDLARKLPGLRIIPAPIDFSYLRGLLDSAELGWRRMVHLDEEQNRVHALYEISSSLLKVSNRNHIAPALENTLPLILDTQIILLVFPADPRPIFFLHYPDGFSEAILTALRCHLKEAWEVLRSDFDVDWNWLPKATRSSDRPLDRDVRPASFVTTPISSGTRTEGFLTVLPRSEKNLDETFLQTFFVIGDLISVLLHNLELRERLEERAMYDGLTRLLNRQTLFERLERECRRSQRHGQPVCAVMMDLDYFKQVNDRFGHQAGDEVLRVVAQRLRNSLREMDIVGRCGGEEFIIVLVNTNLDGGKVWAERFRRTLAEDSIVYLDKKINITASLGVAVGIGESAVVDRLIGLADSALYDAKRAGRNVVVTCNALPPETASVE